MSDFWKFATRLIELLIDRNRGAILLILAVMAVFFFPLAWRLESSDARDVYFHFMDLTFRPATLILIGLNVFQYILWRRRAKLYKEEIKRLVQYKHWFLHRKKDPKTAEQLELFNDIDYVPTDFDLE